MSVVIVTGSAGLIGSEVVAKYAAEGRDVVGIDNNMRAEFFGEEGSIEPNRRRLEERFGARYRHHAIDIRDERAVRELFLKYAGQVELVVHAAAQPSHDWAVRDPLTDFDVNARGTLVLLEQVRAHCPDAVFLFMSTNKVYGDRPNELPLEERETRWELPDSHPWHAGVPEDCPLDRCKHSLFGVSKTAADLMVQEYARYFGMKTVVLRGGVLAGSSQSGVQLHGFLGYLMRCIMTGTPYTIFGYQGKQVRDIIGSHDVVTAIDLIRANPRPGEVYNIGGGRDSNIYMHEAISLGQEIAARELAYKYSEEHRSGDHIWYISDLARLKSHYPEFQITSTPGGLMKRIVEENADRWK